MSVNELHAKIVFLSINHFSIHKYYFLVLVLSTEALYLLKIIQFFILCVEKMTTKPRDTKDFTGILPIRDKVKVLLTL